MHILITGGAGYIGTELTRILAADPAVSQITIYDNLSRKNYSLFMGDKFAKKKIKIIRAELLDTRRLGLAVSEADVVYHLAARVSTPFANEDPHLFDQVNHWGTAELCYLLERSKVKKLIYMSSISVYGFSDKPINEDTEPAPGTYYGISKRQAEKMVELLQERMGAYNIRCGNVYGYSPGMRYDAVINRFMFEAHFSKRIHIQGNGKQMRAFIHIDKVVQTLAGMLHKQVPSGTYNLAEHNFSVLDIANSIQDIYPDLEMLFIQQELTLKGQSIQVPTKLEVYLPLSKTNFHDELMEFHHKFAF